MSISRPDLGYGTEADDWLKRIRFMTHR